MGTGKTTLVVQTVRALRAAGRAAEPIWEGPTVEKPHEPLRLSPTLPHPYAPWQDLTAEKFAAESRRRWAEFAHNNAARAVTYVCDGLLFHGNMTDLLLMGATRDSLERYALDVVAALAPLRPVVVYLRAADVAGSLQRIAVERGQAWQDYQVRWKLGSPYARTRGLEGFEGLIGLYEEYRSLCDEIFRALPVPTIKLDHAGDWGVIYPAVSAFLGVPVSNP